MAKKSKSGVELIAAERKRQIEVEGFKILDDYDNYGSGELIGAAGCYAANALSKTLESVARTNQSPLARFQIYHFGTPGQKPIDPLAYPKQREDLPGWTDGWPWDTDWDKRNKHDILRSLVIAGALIAAEIDRLTELEKPQS